MISVRDMTSQDYAEVREHLSRCWRETYSHLMQPSDFEKMLAPLDSPNLGLIASDGLALVAVDTQGNRAIGTAMAAERRGVGYIWGVYVATDKQRCGIGRTLINEVSARLPSASQFSVIVLEASVEARAFYQALNFSTMERCHEELAPGLIMQARTMVYTRSR
ncbi:Ribosomal protein S18 acetylase RimI [Cohaesibacter sp. ES.047]|uniref:GNAT family N-acetyltransferase n=1 Tax=Cohaesibacter sp. ES.047 TaxID=1798205 RepID=UPI000BB8B296|nr:Ribosomal protein S18 acetylase RimI [Cohaesibacter sp. ES.047]